MAQPCCEKSSAPALLEADAGSGFQFEVGLSGPGGFGCDATTYGAFVGGMFCKYAINASTCFFAKRGCGSNSSCPISLMKRSSSPFALLSLSERYCADLREPTPSSGGAKQPPVVPMLWHELQFSCVKSRFPSATAEDLEETVCGTAFGATNRKAAVSKLV